MPSETDAEPAVVVLSVSPMEDDHARLQEALKNCQIETSSTLAAALATLRTVRFPIIVCERDLSPGSWQDLLEQAQRLPEPPLLIVSSRFADERLWVEALSLGAYDVLTKPFNSRELCRVVDSAWHYWRGRHEGSSAWQGSTEAHGTQGPRAGT